MKSAWEKWVILSKKIGKFQLNLLFSVLYYLIITPVGFLSSFFNNYFKTKSFPVWEDWADSSSSMDKLKEN